jgi:hypothetical protein
MQRDILTRWAPYKFVKEFDESGKLTGVRTEFHKSFLRNKAEQESKQSKQKERGAGV